MILAALVRNITQLHFGPQTPTLQHWFRTLPKDSKTYHAFSLQTKERTYDFVAMNDEQATTWFIGLQALIIPDKSQVGGLSIFSVSLYCFPLSPCCACVSC